MNSLTLLLGGLGIWPWDLGQHSVQLQDNRGKLPSTDVLANGLGHEPARA
jgi:hypothetical protein